MPLKRVYVSNDPQIDEELEIYFNKKEELFICLHEGDFSGRLLFTTLPFEDAEEIVSELSETIRLIKEAHKKNQK
jgi:hypothetical protein